MSGWKLGAAPRQVDVAVVGGGLSGSLAAVVLARAGIRVALIDPHSAYPPDFRVEKLAGDQIDALDRLGLLGAVAAAATPFDRVVSTHRGRVLDRTDGRQLGVSYADLIASIRAELPEAAQFVTGRVERIACGPERQRIDVAGGDVVEARLVVLATGLGHRLRQELGIARQVIFPVHSTTFGFDIVPAKGLSPFPSLTCYGERVAHRIDYLSIFPVGAALRANLFTFWEPRDPEAGELRRDPVQAILKRMPSLGRLLGPFDIPGPIEAGVMDLYVVEGHRRDGVVVVGDAFQTSCPAAGTGVSRVLCDVERLRFHLGTWLATPGMNADKIAAFYDDPEKQATDRRAADAARYRRAVTVDPSLRWEIHRRKARLRRRLADWVRRASPERADRGSVGAVQDARGHQEVPSR